MNVLCTPPAFILSQDQTLEIIVSKHGFCRDLIFLLSSLALSFFYFLLSSILILEFPRSVSSFFLALYFSLVVQFSRIISAPAFAAARLLYHFLFPLSIPFAKVFSTFLKFFQIKSIVALSRLGRACIFYHIPLGLSIPFLQFFSFFCVFGYFSIPSSSPHS